MEFLLNNNYTVHYGFPITNIADISIIINDTYFEIEDRDNQTVITHVQNTGTASYQNVNQHFLNIINYDRFLTAQPHQLQHGRQRCDLIVYTDRTDQYFLLNELKDTNPLNNVDAFQQLSSTLNDLIAVPAIETFINRFNIKRCCFFNKRVVAPPIITATTTFNRINTINQDGFQLNYPSIDNNGFTLWEYSGGKVFTLL